MGESTRAGAAEKPFIPEILLMYCQRCVAPDALVTSGVRPDPDCTVRLVAMPCTSKIELAYLLGILARGTDGVQVVGCPEDGCRFLVGSRMAAKRVQRGRDLLEQVGMGARRIGMQNRSGLHEVDLMDLARHRASEVRPLGPSPMKGATRR